MTEISQKRGRGQPPKHPAQYLRAMVWYRCIEVRYNNLSPYTLEVLLDPNAARARKHGDDYSRPRNFDDYKFGRQVPRDTDPETSIIGRANEVFPGSAAIFRSPIWQILSDKPVTEQAILRELASLGPAVEFLFLEPAAKYWMTDQVLLKDFSESDLNSILKAAVFETFQATILMIGYASLKQNLALRNAFSDTYRRMIRILVDDGRVPFYHRFFDFVDEIAFRLEPTSLSRVEAKKISWRDLYPGLASRPEQQPKPQERRKPPKKDGVLP